MMGRRLLALAALVSAIVVVALPAGAAEVTVEDLIADGAAFDGQTVTVTGELIGDYGNRRDDTTWTQINQDRYVEEPIADGGAAAGGNAGIGAQIPTTLLESVDPPGRYRRVGPVVVVSGVWRYHDPGRGGESFLSVVSLEQVGGGRALSEPTDWPALVAGLALAAAAWLILVLRRRAR